MKKSEKIFLYWATHFFLLFMFPIVGNVIFYFLHLTWKITKNVEKIANK